MNWTIQREGNDAMLVYTAEYLQERLVASLQRTSALAGLDPYRDALVTPEHLGEVIAHLAAVETERRVEMAREAVGDARCDALDDWQLAWLARLAAQDEWTLHVRDLRALFEMAHEQGCAVMMLSD